MLRKVLSQRQETFCDFWIPSDSWQTAIVDGNLPRGPELRIKPWNDSRGQGIAIDFPRFAWRERIQARTLD